MNSSTSGTPRAPLTRTLLLAAGWRLTTEHAASCYGMPVLVSPDGDPVGNGDMCILNEAGELAGDGGGWYYCGHELYALLAAAPDAAPTESKWPAPTEPEPTEEQLYEWTEEGGCEATDGCWVEPDGVCSHGHPAWLLYRGWI